MLRNRRERGEGQFGCLVGLVVVLAVGLISYKMIPVKIKAADLRDTMIDEAKSAGQHSDKHIRKTIMQKAEELELPLDDEGISIKRSGNNTTIQVDVEYTVPIEFPGFTYEWNFHHSTENPIF
jgi:hypothetical protein